MRWLALVVFSVLLLVSRPAAATDFAFALALPGFGLVVGRGGPPPLVYAPPPVVYPPPPIVYAPPPVVYAAPVVMAPRPHVVYYGPPGHVRRYRKGKHRRWGDYAD